MYRKGHYGVALLVVSPAGLALALAGWPGVAVAGSVGVVWLAMLPDLDQRVPGLRHRGPTHSLAFAGVVGAALGGGGLVVGRMTGADPLPLAAVGAGVGVASVLAHLLADALTPAGVVLWWPVSDRRFSLGLTTADSVVWNYALFALGVLAAVSTVVVAARVGALP